MLYNYFAMIKVIFKIDENQDSRNWNRVMTIKNLPYGLIKKKGGVNKKIKDFSKVELKELQKKKERLEKYFKMEGQNIFKTIEKIISKPIYTQEFYVSFTSIGLRPYEIDSNWFMVPATENFFEQLTDICHELLHLQVAYYYKKYCLRNGLTEKQFSDLNEVLTFLLNDLLFKKFNLLPDKGYPNQQKIREKLKKVWNKEKDFSNLIKEAISVIKNSK